MAKLIKKEEPVILWSDDPSDGLLVGKGRKNNKKNVEKELEVIPAEHIIKIRLEKNKRGGKMVSVLFELPANQSFCKKLCKELKSQCGTGGSLKEATIEIQGDHRDKIKHILESKGFQVKLAGG